MTALLDEKVRAKRAKTINEHALFSTKVEFEPDKIYTSFEPKTPCEGTNLIFTHLQYFETALGRTYPSLHPTFDLPYFL